MWSAWRVVDNDLDLLVIGERGISKRTPLKDYRSQTRGGKGILTMSLSEKTGDIVDAKIVSPEDRLLIMTREGITIQLRVDDIRSVRPQHPGRPRHQPGRRRPRRQRRAHGGRQAARRGSRAVGAGSGGTIDRPGA